MAGADGDDGLIDCWLRWPEGHEVTLHAICAVSPVVRDEDGNFRLNREGVRDDAAGEDGASAARPRVTYVTGVVRAGLRFTPLVVLATLAFYVLLTELSPGTVGMSDLLPAGLSAPSPVVVIGVIVWLALLLLPLYVADLRPGPGTGRALVVYGTFALLLSGVGAAILASPIVDVPLRPPDVAPGEWTILNPIGFLTVAFLGGHLLYDTILRTETTFDRLPEKRPSVVSDPDEAEGDGQRRYEAFLADLDEALRSTLVSVEIGDRTVAVPTRYAFAVVFLLPFLASRLGSITEMTGRSLAAVVVTEPSEVVAAFVPFVLDVFLVVLLFQFLVVTAFIHRLFRRRPNSEEGFTLQYRPGHPDGQAGFREFGNYATRINLVLVLAGLYVVYRIYVLGLPLLQTIDPSALTPDVINWLLLFVGPLLVYVVAVLLWLYFSFWRMHRFMEDERTRALWQARRDGSEMDVETVEDAPVWPIDTRLLYLALSLDAVPILTVLPIT